MMSCRKVQFDRWALDCHQTITLLIFSQQLSVLSELSPGLILRSKKYEVLAACEETAYEAPKSINVHPRKGRSTGEGIENLLHR
jgi:hypothetical protein